MSSNDDQKKAPLPTFSGMGMPMNISVDIDDDIGEEVTRRIGGVPMFNPSFEPVAFQPQVFNAGPSISTAPVKASVQSSSPAPPKEESAWKLTDASVLPEFHPLERSAVFVPHTAPAEVSARVAKVLQQRSIQAEFDDSKAKCVTTDNVDFRVFLYRGQKQYNHGIIVEVQRRFGNSVNFYEDTQAILDAAQGNMMTGPPKKKAKTIPLVEDQQDDDKEVSSSSLDFVSKMLSVSGNDAHYLALQTLTSLTDSEKMGNHTAVGVAKVLLTPGNEVGTKVFDMICKKQETKVHDEYGMRLMAMTVLSNVVTALNGDVTANMNALLRPVMIQELLQADSNPQMAFCAAKCIKPLLTYYSVDDDELYRALRVSLEAGKAKHAGLAKQAEACLQKMDR